jgi:hypothetical protein
MAIDPIVGIEKIENEEARRHRLILLGVLASPICLATALPAIVHVLRVNLVPQFYIFCPFLTFTGIPCPFCGLTRSLLSLLRGDFAQAFWHHPFGPSIWGGLALSVFSSLVLLFFQRRVALKIPEDLRTASVVAVVLVVWTANILFGHH